MGRWTKVWYGVQQRCLVDMQEKKEKNDKNMNYMYEGHPKSFWFRHIKQRHIKQ